MSVQQQQQQQPALTQPPPHAAGMASSPTRFLKDPSMQAQAQGPKMAGQQQQDVIAMAKAMAAATGGGGAAAAALPPTHPAPPSSCCSSTYSHSHSSSSRSSSSSSSLRGDPAVPPPTTAAAVAVVAGGAVPAVVIQAAAVVVAVPAAVAVAATVVAAPGTGTSTGAGTTATSTSSSSASSRHHHAHKPGSSSNGSRVSSINVGDERFHLNMIGLLGCVLSQLVGFEEAQYPGGRGTVSMFTTAYAPSISIQQYLKRVALYTKISSEVLIQSVLHIHQLSQHQVNPLIINNLNIHRLLLTSIMATAKYWDDAHYNNAYFSYVGGVPLRELNALEVEFLSLLNFDFYVNLQTYQYFYQMVVDSNIHQGGCGCVPLLAGVPRAIQGGAEDAALKVLESLGPDQPWPQTQQELQAAEEQARMAASTAAAVAFSAECMIESPLPFPAAALNNNNLPLLSSPPTAASAVAPSTTGSSSSSSSSSSNTATSITSSSSSTDVSLTPPQSSISSGGSSGSSSSSSSSSQHQRTAAASSRNDKTPLQHASSGFHSHSSFHSSSAAGDYHNRGMNQIQHRSFGSPSVSASESGHSFMSSSSHSTVPGLMDSPTSRSGFSTSSSSSSSYFAPSAHNTNATRTTYHHQVTVATGGGAMTVAAAAAPAPAPVCSPCHSVSSSSSSSSSSYSVVAAGMVGMAVSTPRQHQPEQSELPDLHLHVQQQTELDPSNFLQMSLTPPLPPLPTITTDEDSPTNNNKDPLTPNQTMQHADDEHITLSFSPTTMEQQL